MVINQMDGDLKALRSVVARLEERVTTLEALNNTLRGNIFELEEKMSRISYPDKRWNDYGKKLAPKSQRSRPADSKKTSGGTKKGKD
jgi:predicted RNase H-like nuclease (RuvC/YqgF family)